MLILLYALAGITALAVTGTTISAIIASKTALAVASPLTTMIAAITPVIAIIGLVILAFLWIKYKDNQHEQTQKNNTEFREEAWNKISQFNEEYKKVKQENKKLKQEIQELKQGEETKKPKIQK